MLALALVLAVAGSGAQDPLDGLVADHPRLLLSDARLAELKELAQRDELLERAVEDCLRAAESLLDASAPKHELRGIRMLHVSRKVLRRVYLLGLAWRWSGDVRFVERLQDELLSVCAFPDWNPRHFLDTAEMTHAVAIGYDWAWAALSPAARDLIRAGLVEKGLRPGLDAFEAQRPAWWTRSEFNWNVVSCGGLLAGALAVAEEEEDLSRALVGHTLRSLPRSLATYDPEGVWPEGLGYWKYATEYAVLALASLESALGGDRDLSQRPGLARTGGFALAAVGPTGGVARFADIAEGARRGALPELLWLGTRYSSPRLVTSERAWLESHPATARHVVFYAPAPEEAPEAPPLDEVFRGRVDVAFLRSARDDPNALWVAFKGGDNRVNHTHLDLGTFELEALGERWVRDLGSDDYDLPGYWDGKQGGRRWSYFRLRSDSHAVVLAGGRQQAVQAKARFTQVHTTGEEARVTCTIEGAFPGLVTEQRRGIALVSNRRAVLVQDELTLSAPGELAWGVTTDAAIEVEGPRAVLTRGAKTLHARILAPQDAAFSVRSAEREPPEARNPGVRRLEIRFRAPAGAARIAVLLVPGSDRKVEPPALVPLERW